MTPQSGRTIQSQSVISFKARSAILPSGHRANAAYWFDDSAGWGSYQPASYYFETLPEWVKAFNARKLADAYVERKWDGFPKWTSIPRATCGLMKNCPPAPGATS